MDKEEVATVSVLRMLAIAAMVAFAVPSVAAAQGENEHHPKGGPGAGKPGGARPFVQPHGLPGGPHGAPPGAMRGPHPGGPAGARFTYHGRGFNRVHLAPFVYPPGYAYRRWAVGALLPPLFLAPAYFYGGWGALGLPPPQPGFQWVRYGPDLLLVNVGTGQVVDVAYGVFY